MPYLSAAFAAVPEVTPVPQPLQQQLGLQRWMVAQSPAMIALGARAQQLAGFNLPVLLLGESGTGKEVLAHIVHDCSPRRSHRFLKINCAALPHDLLESELFGYEAGAFTGATRTKPGHFESCDKGTLFLDEIGELPLALQAKLLHVLQDHRFTRLGGRQELFADVRILAATNVDLPRAMAERQFREDLFFRLNVFSLHLPPLRERQEDILPLTEYFLERYAAELRCPHRPLSPALRECCVRYAWPGNVRELENFVKRYLIFGEQAWLDVSPSAAPPSGNHAEAASQPGEGLKDVVHRVASEVERQTIARALEDCHWNRTVAARALNISYRALLNKLQLYQLGPSAAAARPIAH
ncbi:MAG: sigma-54-dependent Fis family transcriptional regulator [Acidobacteria bacterium]|nr:MAG: sigma-54-dependent Fis family transcriptional regulator [Acidobacteriota bacterium]